MRQGCHSFTTFCGMILSCHSDKKKMLLGGFQVLHFWEVASCWVILLRLEDVPFGLKIFEIF